MITIQQRTAPAARIMSMVCDMCDTSLGPKNRSGLCWDCYRIMHSTGQRCACGVPIRAINQTGLCRDCLTTEGRLPKYMRAEFRYRVKQGGDPFEVSTDLTKHDVQESIDKLALIPTLGAMIIEAVATQLKVRADDLVGANRHQQFVHARACVAMVLLDNDYSYPRIGRVLGGRDHSTIINLAKNFDIYCKRNPRLLRIVETTRAWVKAKRQSWCAA